MSYKRGQVSEDEEGGGGLICGKLPPLVAFAGKFGLCGAHVGVAGSARVFQLSGGQGLGRLWGRRLRGASRGGWREFTERD